ATVRRRGTGSPLMPRIRDSPTSSWVKVGCAEERAVSDELVALASRLISYETSSSEAVLECAGFAEGWLEARGIETKSDEIRGLPVLRAEVWPEGAPTVVLHGD